MILGVGSHEPCGLMGWLLAQACMATPYLIYHAVP